MRGYSIQAFLLKLKEGKARWPPIPFRVMLPKVKWLHQRTQKVKAAAVLLPEVHCLGADGSAVVELV